MEEVKCVELNGNSSICSIPPWIEILKNKLNSAISGQAIIVTRMPKLNYIVLRFLGVKTLGRINGDVVIGYLGGVNNKNRIMVRLEPIDWYSVYSFKLPKFLALPLSELSRVLIYLTIGALGVLVNLAAVIYTYSTLSKYLGLISNTVASVLGFEVSVIFNFTLHELITFRGTGLSKSIRSITERLIKYHSASIASFLSQVSMANLLPFLFKIPVWIGQFVGIVVGFIINFILGYLYTWSRHRIK
jgi:putative flippase GtrA